MEKAMAAHSSILAWKIPCTEEPGRLQFMGSLGVWRDWATSLSLFTFMHWRRKWQPTPVFLPRESQRQRSLVGCRLWGGIESDRADTTWKLGSNIYRAPNICQISCRALNVLSHLALKTTLIWLVPKNVLQTGRLRFREANPRIHSQIFFFLHFIHFKWVSFTLTHLHFKFTLYNLHFIIYTLNYHWIF